MSDIVTGKDSDFSEDRLVSRFNSELANSLGNLLNRTLSMTQRYRAGKLSGRGAGTIVQLSPYQSEMASSPAAALELVNSYVTGWNQEIDMKKPWALAKDESAAGELDALLYRLAEGLRIIAILLSPVLPKAAHGIFDQLNWKLELRGQENRFSLAEVEWGRLPDGHVVGTPVPLFPRIESKPEPAA
jgi:methionyl-tRNA synthetase